MKILEIDEERRRFSLSIKRVEGQNMPMGDLGAQMEAAEGTAETPTEGSEVVAAGPVAGEGTPVLAGYGGVNPPPRHPRTRRLRFRMKRLARSLRLR